MAIEFETTNTPASTRLEATNIQTLTAGAVIKAEIGQQELDSIVPAGKQWDVILSVRVVETDV